MRARILLSTLLVVSSACGKKSPEEVAPPADAPSEVGTVDCGERSVMGPDGTCVAVGVPDDGCAKGFKSDLHGGCTPVLPEAPCAAGSMAVPGESACREVAPCGSGTWGDIPVDATTLYVDRAYTGGGSTGAKDKPFVTIQAAIDAASANPIIAVAAGSYAESLTIARQVRLWGRCPSMVEIKATGARAIAIRAPSELHRVAVTGASQGIAVDADTVHLEEIWIHDTGASGLLVFEPSMTDVVLRNSLVEATRTYGVYLEGAGGTIDRSVIRGTKASGDGHNGIGVHALIGKATTPGALTVTSSLVEASAEAGIAISGSTGTIEGTVVRDTRGRPDGTRGAGVLAIVSRTNPAPSELTLRTSFVDGSHVAGVSITGSKATIERTVIARTSPTTKDKTFGHGIEAWGGADLTLRESLVAECSYQGVLVFGSPARIEKTLVRDIAPGSDGKNGGGIAAVYEAEKSVAASMTLTTSLVLRTHSTGVLAFGSKITMDHVTISETKAEPAESLFGDAVQTTSMVLLPSLEAMPGTIVAKAIVARKSARAGVGVLGGSASLEGTKLTCNPIDLDVEPFEFTDGTSTTTVPASLDDGGGNGCGCETAAECKAQSASLQPVKVPSRASLN